VTRTGVVTGLAVRELWVSFRLLVLLAAYVGAGAVVALVPAPVTTVLQRLAIGLMVAGIAGMAIAAWSLGVERAQGRIGWLVTRSIPRQTVVIGWFVALATVSTAGLAAAAALGWVAVAPSPFRPDPSGYVAVVTGVAAWTWAAIAIGVLLGSLLRPAFALVAAVLVGLLAAEVGWIADTALIPLQAVARLLDLERPIATGLQGAGIGLAIAAAALVLARAALARADL
jgi:hypothetical protein